tara:strand:+ start:2123 stop:2551 length:429 start_codon:yes stop_codon:yes gene_type:complete
MKSFTLGFVTCFLMVAGIAIPYLWPPELSFVFNSLFWSSLVLLINSALLVGYLYMRGGSAQWVQFSFALLLIFSASLMYTSFEEVAQNTEQWKPLMQEDYPTIFALLPSFISYTKNVIAFGFAALGASVAGNIITSRFDRIP